MRQNLAEAADRKGDQVSLEGLADGVGCETFGWVGYGKDNSQKDGRFRQVHYGARNETKPMVATRANRRAEPWQSWLRAEIRLIRTNWQAVPNGREATMLEHQ